VHGSLARGEFVKLAYRLGREQATGALLLDEESGAHELYLRRGYLTSARVEGRFAPLGELLRRAGSIDDAQLARSLASLETRDVLTGRALKDGGLSDADLDAALRRQAELRLERLAAIQHGTYRFLTAAPAPPAHRTGRPFSLTTWARRHAEARVDAVRVRASSSELASGRLVLRKDLAPEPADETDRRILAALASPRSLDELERAANAPRYRLHAFLHFLRTVGALDLPATQRPDAWRLLGVPPDADATQIKAAYRRLARALHPDMHPGATDARRRELAAEFARITAAYDDLC
jgi:DnaJ-domain-containing protein 1